MSIAIDQRVQALEDVITTIYGMLENERAAAHAAGVHLPPPRVMLYVYASSPGAVPTVPVVKHAPPPPSVPKESQPQAATPARAVAAPPLATHGSRRAPKSRVDGTTARARRGRTMSAVIEFLSRGPQRFSDIADGVDVSHTTLSRTLAWDPRKRVIRLGRGMWGLRGGGCIEPKPDVPPEQLAFTVGPARPADTPAPPPEALPPEATGVQQGGVVRAPVTAGESGVCRECGASMITDGVGVSYHVTAGGQLDHDADARHTAIFDTGHPIKPR